MSNVWFCSDLHFGHQIIEKFRGPIGVLDEEDNRSQIKEDWKSVVTKRDDVYVLGDACFTNDTLKDFDELPGRKFLVRGNHDKLKTREYLTVFHEVYGLWKYHEFWLSHAPIHPEELRGKVNLHGHVHFNTLDDGRYFNCCPEYLWKLKKRALISLAEVRQLVK